MNSPHDENAGRSPAAALTNDQLLALLREVRARAGSAGPGEAFELEGSLAALEAEASTRDLKQASERERTPPSLAYRRAVAALEHDDLASFIRFVAQVDLVGLWRLRRALAATLRGPKRAQGLGAIMFQLDARLLGPRTALARQERLRANDFSDHERAAYLDTCLDVALGSALFFRCLA